MSARGRTSKRAASSLPTVERLALYARVSTEDQAERQTVQAQLDFLHGYCTLHQIPVAGVYVDDGVSGVTPLEDRPEGRRLLDDASHGAFTAVLLYRLDRLARSLKVLMTAHDRLEAHGVALKSGTEPFDTSTPFGRAMFQFLGIMAELERTTITARTTSGRDRVAKAGKYTGGPVPIGLDVDDDGYFTRAERVMPVLGVPETAYIADFFRRIADGETSLTCEQKRLTSLGVPHYQRYGGKKRRCIEKHTPWSMNALASIIHNPLYKGNGRIDSRNGPVERPTPALVDAATWERAQVALARNQKLAKRNARHDYLLRGLVRCAHCGGMYSGTSAGRSYRCANMAKVVRAGLTERCSGGDVNAKMLEDVVWREVRAFVDDPKRAIEDAQRTLRERLAAAGDRDEQARGIRRQLAEKEQEHARVISLYRRGKISESDADAELDDIAGERDALRSLLGSLETRAAMVGAQEAYLADVGAALATMRGELADIDRLDDRESKRRLIGLLASRIELSTETVEPIGADGRLGRPRLRAWMRRAVEIELAFREGALVVPLENGHAKGVIATTTTTPGEHNDNDYDAAGLSVVVRAEVPPAPRSFASRRSSKNNAASIHRRRAS